MFYGGLGVKGFNCKYGNRRTNHRSRLYGSLNETPSQEPSFSRSTTALLSPPQRGRPQVTTEPSSRMTAKADCVASMCRTSSSGTTPLSPPMSDSPHVTTEPSLRTAATAAEVADKSKGRVCKVSQSPLRNSAC